MSVAVNYNLFIGNKAGGRGGALQLFENFVPIDFDTQAVLPSTFTVKGNSFFSNKARQSGGAIYVDGVRNVQSSHNLFYENIARDTSQGTGNGGAIAINSGPRHTGFDQFFEHPLTSEFFEVPFPFQGNLADLIASITVEQSVFWGNKALLDGGAISDTQTNQLSNYDFSFFGQLVSIDGPGLADVIVRNSVFKFNKSQRNGGAIAMTGLGQKMDYLLCPLTGEDPCPHPPADEMNPFSPFPNVNYPWVPDESSETRFSRLTVEDSVFRYNNAGQNGRDIFLWSTTPSRAGDISIIGSTPLDCVGDGC